MPHRFSGWPHLDFDVVAQSVQAVHLAIFGSPNDSDELSYEDRISDTHMHDVKAVLKWVKSKSAAPIWVVGTRRGTVSTGATLINLQS